MKKTIFLFVAVLIALTSIGQMKTFKENKNGWKPNDLNLQEGVLLIEKVTWPKNQQKKIEEFMEKNYPYKYEFVDPKDLVDMSKYSDTTKYKFLLALGYSTHTMHQNDPTRRPLNVGMYDYNFIDLPKQKTYPKTGIGSSWASMTFIKIIETLLEKN